MIISQPSSSLKKPNPTKKKPKNPIKKLVGCLVYKGKKKQKKDLNQINQVHHASIFNWARYIIYKIKRKIYVRFVFFAPNRINHDFEPYNAILNIYFLEKKNKDIINFYWTGREYDVVCFCVSKVFLRKFEFYFFSLL